MVPTLAANKIKAFDGNSKQAGSISWSISLKKCNRRWSMALPVQSWRQCTIKGMDTKRWNWSSESKSRPIQSKGHGNSFLGCLRHYAWLSWGQKSSICLLDSVLRKLTKALPEKNPGNPHQRVLLNHNNAPTHSSDQTKAILQEFLWEIIRHPLYSPVLIPDFFLFSNFKNIFKGHSFFFTE